MTGDCRISDDWAFMNVQTVILENRKLRISVVPAYGSKVFEFIYKPSGRDFLYHNPRTEMRPPVYGQYADNWWTGGIDEALPSCLGGEYKGEMLPDFGELWSLAWSWQIETRTEEEVVLHLWRHSIIAPLRIDKWLKLNEAEDKLKIKHRITNLGYDTKHAPVGEFMFPLK